MDRWEAKTRASSDVNIINIRYVLDTMEKRNARLTVLVDPKKKAAFEQLCSDEDVTSSQKIRQLMREFIESRMGPDWREKIFSERES